MSEREYTLERCTMTQLRFESAEIIEEVEGGAIYEVTRYGKPIVYIVPVSLYERISKDGA